jgi:hypothetical protein
LVRPSEDLTSFIQPDTLHIADNTDQQLLILERMAAISQGFSWFIGRLHAMNACSGIITGSKCSYFSAFRELCLLAQIRPTVPELERRSTLNMQPASASFPQLSSFTEYSSQAAQGLCSSFGGSIASKPVHSPNRNCGLFRHSCSANFSPQEQPKRLHSTKLGLQENLSKSSLNLDPSGTAIHGLHMSSLTSAPPSLLNPIAQGAPIVDHPLYPKSQRRWITPLAGAPVMYPDIEEAPRPSMAVPLPFPHSHNDMQTSSKLRQEDWPSTDYLHEARTAIFQKEAFISKSVSVKQVRQSSATRQTDPSAFLVESFNQTMAVEL